MTAGEIRRLAPSEEMFAGAHAFIGRSILIEGQVDVDALAVAFDALVRSYPVIGARLKRGSDGVHVLMPSAAEPEVAIADVNLDDVLAGAVLDQGSMLGAVCVARESSRANVTFFIHHAIADGAHGIATLVELWSFYTDAVEGRPIEVTPHDYPLSAEHVLAARGVAKIPLDQPLQQGDERDPLLGDAEGRAPEVDDQGFLVLQATRTRFSREETAGLIELARSAGVTVNGLISAAILLAEADCRRCPLTDLLYVYAVNLRGMVDPPVAPAEVTNMTGAASYAPTDESPTELLALAQAIRSVLDAQVADCLPLQTPLHTGDDSAALVAPPSRFIVAATNVGRLPELPRPAGLQLEDYRITMLGKPIDTSGQVNSGTCVMNTFNARLGIEVHHSESAAEWERRRIERIKSVVLAAIR